MNIFRAITSNYVLFSGITAWISAQTLKVLFTLLSTRRVSLERLFGAGGMPSSHSALTCAVAIAVARHIGFDSVEFGIAACFAGVVMYDAMGVRRAAGEQAKLLNRIVFELPDFFFSPSEAKNEGDEIFEAVADDENSTPLLDKELKEFLGHTPFEVVGGIAVGICAALLTPGA